MADAFVYKNQKRGRQATVETTFSKGMSYSSAPLEEGYVKTLVNFDFSGDNKILVPRAGLHTTEFVFPDVVSELDDDFYSYNVCIKDMKECIENGETYVQCILGKPDSIDNTKGKIWVATFKKKTDQNAETQFTIGDESFELAFSDSVVYTQSQECVFYNTDLQEIHNCRLEEDSRTGFPVGNFAFGNNYYFFALVEEDGEIVKKLYRTVWFVPVSGKPHYIFEAVQEKTITASEAVQYGYNMLSESPYSAFKNSITGSKIVLEGILPYESTAGNAPLIMTPKRNQRLNYRCYYTAPENGTYKFVWEWRTVDSDTWNLIDTETFTVTAYRPSSVSFIAPAANVLIRVKAYNTNAPDASSENPAVEHAMVVGFDFTLDEHGTTTNVVQKNYNLGDATGMTVWKSRLVIWGIQEDPTIMFLSDMNEPGYFPYPNNITVFDDPIISVLDFMDKLIVFTTSKCYEVALSNDGNNWISTVIQANLHITKWDKHLIQVVRNMIYFKSGNYYYMMVPKAASTTGELTLAPISNPVTEFFNNFSANVDQVLTDTYGPVYYEMIRPYEDPVRIRALYTLITYYNFLDYEDVHNIYVFKVGLDQTLVHFDIIYNTVNRYWRINVLEQPNLLYIYKHDATQSGTYASTSIVLVNDGDNVSTRRVVQLYKFDPLYIRDFFIPDGTPLYKAPDESFEGCYVSQDALHIPETYASYSDNGINLSENIVGGIQDNQLTLLGSQSYIGGFSIQDLISAIQQLLDDYEAYFRFGNIQFLDTGYRADATHYYKRYRELQIQLNNLDGKDLSFGTEFYLDGDIRKINYKYEVMQTIDEYTENYNIAYVEPIMYLDILSDEIDRVNTWTLENNINPELSLWKVRIQVSGKGTAPRLKLTSNKMVRYQLLGLNWVYRVMNMR